jgi:hypothetical protein
MALTTKCTHLLGVTASHWDTGDRTQDRDSQGTNWGKFGVEEKFLKQIELRNVKIDAK